MTLPESSPTVGRRIGDISWPGETVLTAIIRDGRGMAPDRDGALEAGDELMFLIDPDHEAELSRFLSPRDTVATQPQDLDHRATRVVPEESAPIGSASPPMPVSPAALRVLDEHLAKVDAARGTRDWPGTGRRAGPALRGVIPAGVAIRQRARTRG